MVAGAKIDCNKIVGLQLGEWKGVSLHGPFNWTDKLIMILGIWFGPSLQLEIN